MQTWNVWGQSEYKKPIFDCVVIASRPFRLRSKCSICSYQLNLWYEDHVSSLRLDWFLEDGRACWIPSAGRPGIAVPPGSAHLPSGRYNSGTEKKMAMPNIYVTGNFGTRGIEWLHWDFSASFHFYLFHFFIFIFNFLFCFLFFFLFSFCFCFFFLFFVALLSDYRCLFRVPKFPGEFMNSP